MCRRRGESAVGAPPSFLDIGQRGGHAEYFLLENRQRIGADQFLNGTGLLIWHVDSVRYASRTNANAVNSDAAHKSLDLEEADGQNGLDMEDNRGDAGDPWPGTSHRSAFTPATNPGSATYAADNRRRERR